VTAKFQAPAALCPQKTRGTRWIWGWVCHRVTLDSEEESILPLQRIEPRFVVHMHTSNYTEQSHSLEILGQIILLLFYTIFNYKLSYYEASSILSTQKGDLITVAPRSKASNVLARSTLGTWIWIPLEAWICVGVYCVFMLSCVGSGLATGWSPVQWLLPTIYRIQISQLVLNENRQKGLIREDRINEG
jgi:hypothetical protein